MDRRTIVLIILNTLLVLFTLFGFFCIILSYYTERNCILLSYEEVNNQECTDQNYIVQNCTQIDFTYQIEDSSCIRSYIETFTNELDFEQRQQEILNKDKCYYGPFFNCQDNILTFNNTYPIIFIIMTTLFVLALIINNIYYFYHRYTGNKEQKEV